MMGSERVVGDTERDSQKESERERVVGDIERDRRERDRGRVSVSVGGIER